MTQDEQPQDLIEQLTEDPAAHKLTAYIAQIQEISPHLGEAMSKAFGEYSRAAVRIVYVRAFRDGQSAAAGKKKRFRLPWR